LNLGRILEEGLAKAAAFLNGIVMKRPAAAAWWV
jgi:hypothetical protein